MAELSERFAELMARLAKSDAELFRTLGEQNASMRQMVNELTVPAAGFADTAAAEGNDHPKPLALQPQALLPVEDCELPKLKARFRRIPDAQAWLEERLGPAPKKPSWAVLEQTFRQGAWPAAPAKRRSSAAGDSLAQLEQAMLQRLDLIEQRLQQRLDGIEEQIRALSTGG